jgi:hypothetical protein
MSEEFKFSKRTRKGKTYITIKRGKDSYTQLCRALEAQYPDIKITSGGPASVTGVIDIMQLLRKK